MDDTVTAQHYYRIQNTELLQSTKYCPTMGGLQIPRWLGSDPLSVWWLGLAPATLEFWVRFPNERNQGKQAHPVSKYRVPHGSHRLVVYHSTCRPLSSSPPREQLCNRSFSNKHTHNRSCNTSGQGCGRHSVATVAAVEMGPMMPNQNTLPDAMLVSIMPSMGQSSDLPP